MADWDVIKKVKETVKIPVFANGNIQCYEDLEKCLKHTGCDGVMVAETLLENPALFSGKNIERVNLALEYLEIAKTHNTPHNMVRHHLFYMLSDKLNIHIDLREMVATERGIDGFIKITSELKDRLDNNILPPKDFVPTKKRKKNKKSEEEELLEEESNEKEKILNLEPVKKEDLKMEIIEK